MFMRWLFPVIAIPFTIFVLIPLVIVSATQDSSWKATFAEINEFNFWAGALFGALGLALSGWTVGLFARYGEGTAAPWDPPQHFVVRGPYLYVRNPMVLGAFAILISEALFLNSVPIFIWCLLLVGAKYFYIPRVEEKELEERFGNEYLVYKKNVPRWIPRKAPWQGP